MGDIVWRTTETGGTHMTENQNEIGDISSTVKKLEDMLRSQARLLEELRREVLRLSAVESGPAHSYTEEPADPKEDANRRAFLRKAIGVAAGAGVASALAGALPAAAANGDTLVVGQSRTGTSPTELENTNPGVGDFVSALKVTGPPGKIGVIGTATGAAGVGIQGESAQGYGLYGFSSSGYGVYVGGNGRLGTVAHSLTPGRPTVGTFAIGDIVRDSAGTFYCCIEAGTPGLWREIAGPSSVGALHLISPLRVANTFDGTGLSAGAIALNGQKSVTITSPIIPSTATAVIGNVTAYSPFAFSFGYPSGGYLAVNANGAGGGGVANTFQINTISNGALFISRLAGGNALQVNSYGSASHVTLDILGYWA